MKTRILTGWTLPRALYAVTGIFILVQSGAQREWAGVAFGAYFAAMGIFAFGCAGGNCSGTHCATNTNKYNSAQAEDINYTEVKPHSDGNHR